MSYNDNIFELVIRSMEKVENFTTYTNEQKRNYVKHICQMRIIEKYGFNEYQKYELIIPEIIEFIIDISKNKIFININKRKPLYNLCW